MFFFFGGGIEVVQPTVGRSGEWANFYADVVGIGISVFVALLLRAVAQGLKTT